MQAAYLNEYEEKNYFTILKDAPIPNLQPEDNLKVKINVKYCLVTHADIETCAGLWSEGGRYNINLTMEKKHGDGHENDTKSNSLLLGRYVGGIIHQVGSEVHNYLIGDEVIAIGGLSLTEKYEGGYAEYAIFSVQNIMKKPPNMTFPVALSCIYGGIRAITSLHYKCRIQNINSNNSSYNNSYNTRETVLIYNGTSPDNYIVLQYALHWGLQIFVTASTSEEVSILSKLGSNYEDFRIINTSIESIEDVILSETAGMGVNHIIDSEAGDNPFPSTIADIATTTTTNMKRFETMNSKLITNVKCVALHGNIVTSDRCLQISPDISIQMLLKQASLCFVFEPTWILAPGSSYNT